MDGNTLNAPARLARLAANDVGTVMKFGGSSVANTDKIVSIADKVAAARAECGRVLVVVSAMGKTTNELIAKARAVSDSPAARELDALLSSGEQVTTALLAMALEAKGVSAMSMTGVQCGIRTEGPHSKSRITEIQPDRVHRAFDDGKVVVLAGFQGINQHGDVTTLGRGGSDTSAVAIASALGVPHCDIYSDVDGVYSTDPRICPGARHLGAIDYETMQELSRLGAKVLHRCAVQYAQRGRVTIRARSTFGSERETLIGAPSTLARAQASRVGVVAVAGRKDLIRIRTVDLDVAAEVRSWLGEHVPLFATVPAGRGEELWAVGEELPNAEAFAAAVDERWKGKVRATPKLGSVSVVGPRITDIGVATLDQALWRAHVAPVARTRTKHAAVAMLDAEHVDEAIRSAHRAAIETADEVASWAS